MVYCVAFGCNNNSCNSKNISFFRFPGRCCSTPRIRRVGWRASPYSRLCSLHFSSNCFVGFSACRHQLIPGSVPSIFFSYLKCNRPVFIYQLAPMTSRPLINRDSKFSEIEFIIVFSWKIVFICNDCKWQKSFVCIDLSKYRLITNLGILCLWSLRGQLANPGSPGKWLLKQNVCVCGANGLQDFGSCDSLLL